MQNKFFPIETEPACRLKWAWSTLYLNTGQTASCHRASVSDLTTDQFEQFHNTEEKLQDRRLMLAGKWPENGCEYCRNIEAAGGVSDRQFQNQVPEVYPRNLDSDPTAISVDPAILEVFFSNTCNFKCVYCEGSISSAIQAEDSKYGGPAIPIKFSDGGPNRYNDLAPKFWNWFDQHSHSLMRLQVLGGEPFLQRDLFKLLDFFNKQPHPTLEFNVVTNLGVPHDIIFNTAEIMAKLINQKKVKRIDIQVSIDGWGHGQEYVRYGLDLKTFENNILMLLKHRVFRVGLLSTVTSLSIKEMPSLAEKFLEWKKTHDLFWYIANVLPVDSSPFDPKIFRYEIFENDLKKTLDLIPDVTWDDLRTRELLQGILVSIRHSSATDPHRGKELIKYLDEIDRRRNLDWKQTFPWLHREIDNVV